jgi:hypothetical protein
MVIDIKKLRLQQRNARPENRERRRLYSLANKEKHAAYSKKWREANPELRRASKRRWEKANPEKHAESTRRQHREYMKKRKAQDLDFRICVQLRDRTSQAIKNESKAGSAVRDLGMSSADFKLHIASQFSPGMEWETWGSSFELDHIYPLAGADLNDRCQFKAVANWRNYQPLTPEDNSTKGDSITDAARERFEVLANFLEVM